MTTNDTPKSINENSTIKSRSDKCDNICEKNNDKTQKSKSIKKYPDCNDNKLVCILCNYTAKTVGNFNKHLKTQKHLSKIKGGRQKKFWVCLCGKEYSNRQNFYRHKSKS